MAQNKRTPKCICGKHNELIMLYYNNIINSNSNSNSNNNAYLSMYYCIKCSSFYNDVCVLPRINQSSLATRCLTLYKPNDIAHTLKLKI